MPTVESINYMYFTKYQKKYQKYLSAISSLIYLLEYFDSTIKKSYLDKNISIDR